MSLTQTAILSIATAAMIGAMLLTLIPLVPGTVIVWGIGIITAFADQFDRVTVAAAIAMTAIMLTSVTRDIWLPWFGVRMAGLSCLTSVGAIIGGILGAIFIPIPVLDVLIGTVAGAMVVELIAARRIMRTIKAGGVALQVFVMSYLIEIASVIAIFIVFIVSIASTG